MESNKSYIGEPQKEMKMIHQYLQEAYQKKFFQVCYGLIAYWLFDINSSSEILNELLSNKPNETTSVNWVEWYLQEAKYPINQIYRLIEENQYSIRNRLELFERLLMPTNNRFFSVQPSIPWQEILMKLNEKERKIAIRRIVTAGFVAGLVFLTEYGKEGKCKNYTDSWLNMLSKNNILYLLKKVSMEGMVRLLALNEIRQAYFGSEEACLRSFRYLLQNPSVHKIKEFIISLCNTHAIPLQTLHLAYFNNEKITSVLNTIFGTRQPNDKPQYSLCFFPPVSFKEEELYLARQKSRKNSKLSFGPITSFEQFESRFASLEEKIGTAKK